MPKSPSKLMKYPSHPDATVAAAKRVLQHQVQPISMPQSHQRRIIPYVMPSQHRIIEENFGRTKTSKQQPTAAKMNDKMIAGPACCAVAVL